MAGSCMKGTKVEEPKITICVKEVKLSLTPSKISQKHLEQK